MITPAQGLPPPLPPQQENDRLAALERFDVLDTPREEAFDRITRLTRKLFDVPVAIVSFLDAHRQWYKSYEGVHCHEVPRESSFCQHVVASGLPLVVPDAALDGRFERHPFVLGAPHVRFYAGVPLRTGEGHSIGVFCILDHKPRQFQKEQVEILCDLARMAMDELDLRVSASHDSLTGALSRKAFKKEAGRLSALALRHQHELSAIALDLDHFKAVNDTFGHGAGDIVLARTVATCRALLRETDLIGRLGGEEFAVLLPNTPQAGAIEVVEKLRRAIERQAIRVEEDDIATTASFGIASLDHATRDADALLENADRALYEAKEGGRNRAVAWKAASPLVQRRRVLKGGIIQFNGRTSSIACTVRLLSEGGAGIDVSSTVGVPKSFHLAIKADGFERRCRVVSQSERRLEVEFC